MLPWLGSWLWNASTCRCTKSSRKEWSPSGKWVPILVTLHPSWDYSCPTQNQSKQSLRWVCRTRPGSNILGLCCGSLDLLLVYIKLCYKYPYMVCTLWLGNPYHRSCKQPFFLGITRCRQAGSDPVVLFGGWSIGFLKK